jgi:hypothetical protein
MITRRNPQASGRPHFPLLGFAEGLFIAFLTVMLFLLARSVAHHHFLGGGQDNTQTKSPNRQKRFVKWALEI